MRRIVSIGLIGLGASLFFAAVAWINFNNLITHPTAVSLPDQIAGLQMTEYKTGTEAAADFVNLHDKQFPIASGAIGVYGNGQIMVWAAGAPFNFITSRMIDAMQAKIARGKSPFTPIEQLKQGNRIIHILEGMGQKHFYFQSRNLVVWLAADPALADQALQQILEAYP